MPTDLKCTPMEGKGALSAQEVGAHLAQVPAWQVVNGAIERVFRFADYHRTMAFVNAVAWIAHQQDHHPDLQVSWGSCTVRYHTHAVGGLSPNDFICARLVDALVV